LRQDIVAAEEIFGSKIWESSRAKDRRNKKRIRQDLTSLLMPEIVVMAINIT